MDVSELGCIWHAPAIMEEVGHKVIPLSNHLFLCPFHIVGPSWPMNISSVNLFCLSNQVARVNEWNFSQYAGLYWSCDTWSSFKQPKQLYSWCLNSPFFLLKLELTLLSVSTQDLYIVAMTTILGHWIKVKTFRAAVVFWIMMLLDWMSLSKRSIKSSQDGYLSDVVKNTLEYHLIARSMVVID